MPIRKPVKTTPKTLSGIKPHKSKKKAYSKKQQENKPRYVRG